MHQCLATSCKNSSPSYHTLPIGTPLPRASVSVEYHKTLCTRVHTCTCAQWLQTLGSMEACTVLRVHDLPKTVSAPGSACGQLTGVVTIPYSECPVHTWPAHGCSLVHPRTHMHACMHLLPARLKHLHLLRQMSCGDMPCWLAADDRSERSSLWTHRGTCLSLSVCPAAMVAGVAAMRTTLRTVVR
jgi:hypothetical protein